MADIFVKIGDIKGESVDAKHIDEIEVLSWSWGVSESAAVVSGGGAGAGKPNFQDFQMTHGVDKASPVLLTMCATGQHISSATMTQRKAGAGQQEFLVITMTDVVITSVHPGGNSSPGGLVETVSLQCAKIDLEYMPQKPDGSLDTGIHFTFDIKANKVG
jgi:type VI secretion system secreted protein Hcp